MSLSSISQTTHSGSEHQTSWFRSIRFALAEFRRKYLPTDAELDMEYLNGSADLRDLEYRMRRLDEMRAQSRTNAYQRL
jgi:hypothetical protein